MDGPPPEEENFTTLPVSDRLAHKNWKARVSGYETLVKTFQVTSSDTDPAFRPYISNGDLLRRIALDANAVAQEKGVECLVALVKFAGENAAKTRESVVPALVEKCLGSTRAGTRTQALELVLHYVEVENGGAGVVGDLLPGLGAKQPKAVAGCVLALKEIVRLFGIQATPPPPILKSLPKIFAHSDKTVRAEGTGLVLALYSCIGVAIEPWLAELKPLQIKELKDAFEALEKDGKGKGSVVPERMTREQARKVEAAADDPSQGDDAEQPEEEDAADLDPRASAEPVDIGSKLPAYAAAFSSSKWKDRKEAIDEIQTVLASVPRIKDGSEIGDLAKALATRIQADANVACVMVAAGCLETLAKGVMAPFGRYHEAIVGLMMERLKERKATVTDAIGLALDAIFQTTTLADIVPDMLPALGSKNPQVKEGALKFLSRCLANAKVPLPSAQIKSIADPLAALLEDSFEGARNEAATCLGTLMKMVGERPLTAVVEGLADTRKVKVKEAFEKATVKCKVGAPPRAAAPPAAAPKKKAPGAKAPPPVIEDEPSPPKKLAAKPVLKKAAPSAAAPKKAATSAPAKPAKGGASAAPGSLDTFKYQHTPEDAEALAAELIPPAMLADLGDAAWKVRLAALEEMTTWVEGVIEEVDAEVVVRALAKKGWADKNFQVSAKIYGIITLLATQCPSFGRSCAAICVGHLIEKLADMKLKKPAGETLTAFAEKLSLQFILNQAYDPLSKAKAPKIFQDSFSWMDNALSEFGIAGVALRPLIESLKAGLNNSNAGVRTSATKTLVTLKLFVGPSVKDFLEDLNPQLLKTITSEFDKVEGKDAPEPERFSADLANLAALPASASGGKSGGGGDPMDELFPRVDVDIILKGSTVIADTKNDSWKVKKEGLEAFQAILEQADNKRLKPNMGEIGGVLKARTTDANKAVQVLALDVICKLAVGMGKGFERHSRLFTQSIATVLADQKTHIRAAAIQALTTVATACESVESMVPGIATALEAPNPTQKGSLLAWIVDWLGEHPPTPGLDITAWASPVVLCLDDRNPEVRKGAQGMLPILMGSCGFDYVMQQTNSLKPASKKSAVPIIQAARPAAPAPVPKAKATPAAKAAPKPVAVARAVTPVEEEESPPPSPAKAAPPASKLTGLRRKLPAGTSRPETRSATPVEAPASRLPGKPALGGLKRPGAPASKAPPPQAHTPSSSSAPFMTMTPEAKRARCAKDAQRWVNEGGVTRKDLAELLQHQMEPHASKELVALLFSHDHSAVNDFVSGLTKICQFFNSLQDGEEAYGLDIEDARAVGIANFDLALKYASMKAHESQPNLISKCLEVVESVLGFLRSVNVQLTEPEATCFIPTMVHKLGDAREPVRIRVQNIIQSLPKVYAYSRVFQVLLEHGLKSKVAKTRQGALEEMSGILKRSGMGACEPNKAFPILASMISDKDSSVRKSALGTIGEGYSLVGEKIWALVGFLSPKDKTQLEERLRRITGPAGSTPPETPAPPAQVARLAATGMARPGSPAGMSRIGGLPRPSSPSVGGGTRIGGPSSPYRSASPAPAAAPRPISPAKPSRLPPPSAIAGPSSPSATGRPKSMMPSRLGRPRSNFSQFSGGSDGPQDEDRTIMDERVPSSAIGHDMDEMEEADKSDDITITISSILSSDPSRSVDALKKIQKILSVGPEAGPSSPAYRELAEHTEGLIETITLQMAHIFDRPDDLVPDDNFRLAKHLIQTLNNFCDHAFLAESLTVGILTSLLEELTLRLLETDDSQVKKVKDLSRFINMIILRLFATGRRMSIFRALFALLLQIVKPFPANGTPADSKESKVAELVLKCVWKLARNIPQDLTEQLLDPVELFPAIEHFLQSVPPNEWRARATNKVPCGDMPLRTIKVIIQHVVAHYGDDVYDLLSSAFDDPSATIVYPYVYRILNSSTKPAADGPPTRRPTNLAAPPLGSPMSNRSSRPISPHGTSSSVTSASHQHSSPSRRMSPTSSSVNGNENGNGALSATTEEPDPDAQLLLIIGHISSETTGALHKEGITELHHFLKQYPHKRPRVEKMLESTGAAFRKYITRALASRAAEDKERDVAVADTLTKLESNGRDSPVPTPTSPVRTSPPQLSNAGQQDKLSRLHDIFRYQPAPSS